MPNFAARRFDWDDFRLIAAIVETGGLNGAAERLGLNHSTVFRRLGVIEEAVGRKLFERLRGGYEPTAVGAEMAGLAARMGADVAEFERRLAGCDPTPAGELKVAVNDSFAVYLMPPLCAEFARRHPQVRLDLIVGDRASNLALREADVALRASAAPQETLVGRRIAAIGWAVYASPQTLERCPDPDDPQARWIGYGERMRVLAIGRALEARVPPERIVYRTSSIVGQVEAAAAGLGFAQLPCFVGDSSAGVARVGPVIDRSRALWLLTHPDLRQSARVRAFMDFFGEELGRRRKRFEGEDAP